MTGDDSESLSKTGEMRGQTLLVDVLEAARQLGGISDREVYRLMERGEIEGIWQGRRRMVVTESLVSYVERLRAAAKVRVAA